MTLIAYFQAWDLAVLYWINQHHTPVLDKIMAYVSDFDSWRWPLLLAVLTALRFGSFRLRLLLAMMLACLVIGDGGINWCFKLSVNRPRPLETEPHLRVVTVREVTASEPKPVRYGRSFTSGHACNNLALALVATALYGRAAWFLWPWALLVSYSRVYCASHYPSDILGSWIVATFYTFFILRGADWLWRRYAPSYFPDLHRRHPLLFPTFFPGEKLNPLPCVLDLPAKIPPHP